MKNRLIINLLLLSLVIALATVAWVRPGQVDLEPALITSLEIDSINRITIERQSGDTVTLTRSNNLWTMTRPISAPALLGKIERLLKISQIKPPISHPLDESKHKLYGLERPIARIQFDEQTLVMGNTESIHARRYVSDGKQLYLLDDTFLHHLTAPVTDFIDTRLLADGVQITAIQTSTINLQQNKNNVWHDALNPTDDLSPDAVQMLLDEWRFARAINVQTEWAESPSESIKISFTNKPAMLFELILKNDNVLLVSPDKKISYQFSARKYKKMTTLPSVEKPNA